MTHHDASIPLLSVIHISSTHAYNWEKASLGVMRHGMRHGNRRKGRPGFGKQCGGIRPRAKNPRSKHRPRVPALPFAHRTT